MIETRVRKVKLIVLIVSIVLVISVVVGTTFAFLIDTTDSIENTFTPSDIATDIIEDFNGEIKKDVKIKNTGDIDAYIRAAVVICWKHESDGSVYGVLPVEGTDYDYTIDWSGTGPNGGWQQGIDGFYYHLAPVAAGKETSVLFTNCQELEGANKPEGYVLSVEIIASGIQSVPASVVTEMWSSGVSGVNSDATLVIKEPTTGGEG